MSDALPLPPRPNLEQYKKLAKDLQRAANDSDANAIREWAARLAETQLRLHGAGISATERADIVRETGRIEERWKTFTKRIELTAPHSLTTAQLFLARAHDFASWPKFAEHLQNLARESSPVSMFEAAADAIVNGDRATLGRLLLEYPELVRARSSRAHRSTLLHYVSANGIEDFRQKTPRNIVEITRLLLGAGADVNAESDAYGGRSTTLGLVATSVHPERAGVQLELMELLLGHGAVIDPPDGGSAVNGCLHNGRGDAAVFLAGRGASLDLEGACGIGDLETVKRFVGDDGTPKAGATKEQLLDGFAWACEFGRTAVVEFLLDHGVDVAVKVKHHGQTGLHWAAANSHIETVKLLLARKAPVDAKDAAWGSTPLGWALHGWKEASNAQALERYYETVSLLVGGGAAVQPDWLADERIRADRRMLTALKI